MGVERAHRDQKSKMGNKICSSKKSVDISNIEADGKNPIDVNDNPSEEKTAAFVKQMSVTEAGEGKKRINMQVEFHALLHDLKENGQLSQKKQTYDRDSDENRWQESRGCCRRDYQTRARAKESF